MSNELIFKSEGEVSLIEIGEFIGINGEVSMSDLYNVNGKKIFDNRMYAPNIPSDINVPISMDNFYNFAKKIMYTLNITGNHTDVDYLNIGQLLKESILQSGITKEPNIVWDGNFKAEVIVNIQSGANLSGKNIDGGSTLRTGTGLEYIRINNYGNIWGRGGNGGGFHGTTIFNPQNGKNAILIEQNCEIINHSTGKIYGGGGGGAKGISLINTIFINLTIPTFNYIDIYNFCNGGAGAGGASGGDINKDYNSSILFPSIITSINDELIKDYYGQKGGSSSNSITSTGSLSDNRLVNNIPPNDIMNVTYDLSIYPHPYNNIFFLEPYWVYDIVTGTKGGNFGQDGENFTNIRDTPSHSVFNKGTNQERYSRYGGKAGNCIKKTASNITVTLTNQGVILGPNDATLI
jgi:hypothetical protein